MPKLTLTRALTYQHEGVMFKRGVIMDVPEKVYHDLLRRGGFQDPDCAVDFVNPLKMRGVPYETTVPVIRDMGLGDVLMAAIPLRDLAARNPRLKFIYCVDSRYVPLFEDLEFIERCIPIHQLKGPWAYGVDLRGYVERNRHQRKMDRIDIFSHYLLGGPPSSYDFPQKKTRGRVQAGLEVSGINPDRPAMGLVIRASMLNRSWGLEQLQRFARIADREGYQVVLLNNKAVPQEWFTDIERLIDLTGRLDMRELMNVTAALDVMVTPDTGTLHLAEALDTRCVVYMTTVPPALRISHYHWTRCVYAEGKLSCLGCTHSPTCGGGDPRACAVLCTPEAVWSEVEYVMEREPPWPVMANDGDGPCRFKGVSAVEVA